ncbi:MAG: DUF2851 family protein [Bacteroidales bacterium]|nr:DUF2851 family protein [Bacteroidales bacterium]
MLSKEKEILSKWFSTPIPFFLTLSTGENLTIYFHGMENRFDGPDIIGCVARTNDAWLVGNIEIHRKSSDWYVHGHHMQKAYDQVLFQLVDENDKICYTSHGRIVPVVELQHLDTYRLVCCEHDSSYISDIIRSFFFSRLEQRKNFFRNLCKNHNYKIYDAIWHHILIGIGKPTYADLFEWVGYQISWSQAREIFHKASLAFFIRSLISCAPYPLHKKTLPNGSWERKICFFEELFHLKKISSLISMMNERWNFFKTQHIVACKQTILRYYVNALMPILCVLFPNEEDKLIKELEFLTPERNSIIVNFTKDWNYKPIHLLESQGILEFIKQKSRTKFQQTIKMIHHEKNN